MSDYDERREQRREEQRRYEADVAYEVWRSGGNTDRIDPDRVNQRYWDGQDVSSTVSAELRAQRPKPPPPSEEEWNEQQYPSEHLPPEP